MHDNNKTVSLPASDAVLDLGQKLLCKIAGSAEPGENLLLSPLSIGIILGQLADAAKGESREEVLRFLSPDSEKTLEEISTLVNEMLRDGKTAVANAIYADEDTQPFLLPSYVENVGRTAATDILPAAKDAAAVINRWVCEKTRGMIPKLYSSNEDPGNLSVLNAVAFDAEWKDPYEPEDRHDGEFTRLDGTQEAVHFLRSSEEQIICDEIANGFLKPYADSDFAFMALLPRQTKDPAEFLQSLPEGQLGRLIRSASGPEASVNIPEFTFDHTINLREVLEAGGVKRVFEPESADLSNMVTLPGTYVSGITHKTHIEVDRKGTKAAAVSAMALFGCWPDWDRMVILDRPFVFGIVHQPTGIPLFLGIVNSIEKKR